MPIRTNLLVLALFSGSGIALANTAPCNPNVPAQCGCPVPGVQASLPDCAESASWSHEVVSVTGGNVGRCRIEFENINNSETDLPWTWQGVVPLPNTDPDFVVPNPCECEKAMNLVEMPCEIESGPEDPGDPEVGGSGNGGQNCGSPLWFYFGPERDWCPKLFGGLHDGAPCDIDGNGRLERCSGPQLSSADDFALLVRLNKSQLTFLSRGGSLVPTPSEFFGEFTAGSDLHSTLGFDNNGFAALIDHCGVRDGRIYIAECGLMFAFIGSGAYITAESLRTPEEIGVEWVSAEYKTVPYEIDHNGNSCRMISFAGEGDRLLRNPVYDVWISFAPLDSENPPE